MLIHNPKLLKANVMHQRLKPKKNGFTYGVYYIAIPIDKYENGAYRDILPTGKLSKHSFHSHDHGYRDGTSLRQWANDALMQYDIPHPQHITLITMPRIFGYVFNPISFWLCYDKNDAIIAVICEVNNTFGETHSYVCIDTSHNATHNTPISKDTYYYADKLFHVSPFLERIGAYKFQFNINDNECHITIDYHDGDDDMLLTSLRGEFSDLSRQSLNQAFWQYPLVTLKTIALIHYQALCIIAKGISYIKKPTRLQSHISKTRD